eukprot:Gb_35899 [translate_table: standard]
MILFSHVVSEHVVQEQFVDLKIEESRGLQTLGAVRVFEEFEVKWTSFGRPRPRLAWRRRILNNCPEISNNRPLALFPSSNNLCSSILYFCYLKPSEICIHVDLVREGGQLLFRPENMKSILKRPTSEDKSGICCKPGSLCTDILQIQCVMDEG